VKGIHSFIHSGFSQPSSGDYNIQRAREIVSSISQGPTPTLGLCDFEQVTESEIELVLHQNRSDDDEDFVGPGVGLTISST